MTTPAVSNRRLGPILLSQGVTPGQIFVFFGVLLCGKFAFDFIQMVQPLLIAELLHAPAGKQGVFMGALTATQHTAVLLTIGVAGAVSDRIGRRRIMVMALCGFAICLWIYPLASAIWLFFGLRFFFGMAWTGHIVGCSTKMMDYPDNASRGKFIGLMMIVQLAGAAAFTTFVGSRLISWLKATGMPAAEAIRYGFWGMSVIAVAGALIAFFLLHKDRPEPTAQSAESGGLLKTIAGLGEVFGEARRNPRMALVLLISAVIRTDDVLILSFLGLWIVQAGRAQGIDPIEATRTIGLLLAIQQVSGFVTPPLFGWLADRIDRLALLIGSLGLTAVAFCAFGLVTDVFSLQMVAVMVLVGLANGAQSISANAVLGEECPPEMRGRAMSVFTFIGTVSVLAISMVAGVLFDRNGPASPFIMEGLLNFAVCVVAVALVWLAKRRSAAPAAG